MYWVEFGKPVHEFKFAYGLSDLPVNDARYVMAEEQPDWLQAALDEAAEKTKDAPAMIPPAVSSAENAYVNISEEEKEKRFKRGNAILIAIIIVQIIALGFVIWWP